MALTEQKIKDLEDKGFHKLYDDKEDEWIAMCANARQFAKDNICAGNEPRPDDVAQVLLPMLKINDAVREHQEANKARGVRFVNWFCEYVIDKSE